MGFLSGVSSAVGGVGGLVGGGAGIGVGSAVAGPIGAVAGGYVGNRIGSGNSVWTPWSRPGDDWQFDASGAPKVPTYQAGKTVTPDSAGMDQYRSLALGDTSPWTSKLLEKEAFDTQTAGQALDRQTAAAAARAQDDVAMSGGLTGGAAERIASESAKQGVVSKQNLERDAASRRMGIEAQGQEQKLRALAALPGMELANAQFQYAQGRDEADRQNAFNQYLYGVQGDIWGKGQLANQAESERKNQSLWDKIF